MPEARSGGWWRCALAATALAAWLPATAWSAQESSYAKDAQQYLEKGDLKAALIELRNAEQQAPQDPKIRAALAAVYLRLGDPESAAREARAARQLKGGEADYLPVLAEALLRQGKFADLLGEVQPDDRPPALESKARLAIGVADAALNRDKEAEAALRDAVRLDPGSLPAKLALARLLVPRNPTEAGKIIDQVLAVQPHFADALVVQGTLLQAKGDNGGAMARFDAALKIDPNNLPARLSRAALAITEGKFADADGDLDPLLEANSRNVQANYLRAIERFQQKRYAAADALLDRISPAFGTLWGGYYLQAATKFDLGQYAQAEGLAAKYLGRAPSAVPAARLAAVAALRQNAPARAIGYLQPVADKNPADAQTLSLLGGAYLADGKPELALQQFQKAAALEPGNPKLKTAVAVSEIGAGQGQKGLSALEQVFSTQAGTTVAGPTLVLTELHAGHADQAAAAAAKLVQQDPKNSLYQTLLGSARFQERDFAAAETALRAAIALRPGFDAPIKNLAQLYLATGRADDAAKAYQDLLAKKPDDVAALVGLAQVAVAQRRWPQAEDYLDRARSAAPNDPAPGVDLVNFYLLRKAPDRATLVAGQLAAQFRANPDVLDAQGRAQVAAGDKQAATSTFRRAHELAPDSAPILARYLALLTAAKDFATAQTVLEQAIDRYPKNAALKADLVRIEGEGGGLAAGLAKARSFAKADPDNPVYDIVSAELYEKAGKQPDAVALLERAAAAKPSNDQLTLALAALYGRTAAPAKAEALLKSRLAADPKDSAVETALASFYLNQKNYPAALAGFQHVASEQPKDAAALNNLAWLYQQQGDLAKAAQLAGQALALAPGNGSIEDTLGWILLAQGQTAQAVTHLTAANQAVPADPSIQYHLAAALDRAGRPADARAILEKLLGSGAAFGDKTAAQELLQRIKS